MMFWFRWVWLLEICGGGSAVYVLGVLNESIEVLW